MEQIIEGERYACVRTGYEQEMCRNQKRIVDKKEKLA